MSDRARLRASVLVLLAGLWVAVGIVGCCGAPIEARRDAAADLLLAVERRAEAQAVLDRALVPHPDLDDEQRQALADAEASRRKADAEIDALAHELAGAEGAR